MIRRLVSVLFVIVSLIRRCFCCFRRRKDQDLLVSVRDDYSHTDPTWDDWEGPSAVVCESHLSPVEQQIHQYRLAQQKKLMESQQPAEQPKEPDLFQDLAPSLPKKPQVVIYARPEDDNLVSNRQNSLSCTDALMQVGGELGEWSEDGNEHLWNEVDEEIDPQEIEQVMHQQRQQQRKQQKLAREAKKTKGKQKY